MEYRTLDVQINDRIAVVTFNRPAVLNAMDADMCREIASACAGIDADKNIRVAVFTGSGRAFIAGADIAYMQPLDAREAIDFLRLFQSATKGIEDLEVPTIAAVNGFCFGGGNELAISCDLRIASEDAKFGQQEINLGIMPASGGTQRLTRLLGYGRAMEFILTGDVIDAQTAERYGLVNRVVPADSLMDEAMKLAASLSRKSRDALIQAKGAVKASRSMDLEKGLEFELLSGALLWATEDQKTLMKAFVEKQKK